MGRSNKYLKDIVSFKTGKLNSNAATTDGKYPFFTCAQEVFKTDTYSFDTECVLLGGNNASAIYPIKYFSGKFDAYQRTYVIEPLDRNSLNTKFLFYCLGLQLDLLRRISTGVTTKFLTLGMLNNLQISLPLFPVQQRIASILGSYDDLIENNTRRINLLEQMAQRIYKQWFVDFKFPSHENAKFIDSTLGKIPQGWEVKNLFDVAEITYGFPFKSNLFNETNDGEPVIRIRNLKEGNRSRNFEKFSNFSKKAV